MNRLLLATAVIPSSSFVYAALLKISLFFRDPNFSPNHVFGSVFDIVLLSIALFFWARSKPRHCVLFLAIVFGLFSFYHFAYFGKQCSCFGANSNSSVNSIVFTGLFSIGLFLASMSIEKSATGQFVALLLVLGGACALDQKIVEVTSHNQSVLDFQKLERMNVTSMPFKGADVDISDGTWDVWLLDHSCGECIKFTNSMVPPVMVQPELE